MLSDAITYSCALSATAFEALLSFRAMMLPLCCDTADAGALPPACRYATLMMLLF
jgi:hypothetical protein